MPPFELFAGLLISVISAITAYRLASKKELHRAWLWAAATAFLAPLLITVASSPMGTAKPTHSPRLLIWRMTVRGIILAAALALVSSNLPLMLNLEQLFSPTLQFWFGSEYTFFVEGNAIQFHDKVIRIEANGSRLAGSLAIALTLSVFFRGKLAFRTAVMIAAGLGVGLTAEYMRYLLEFQQVAGIERHMLPAYRSLDQNFLAFWVGAVLFVTATGIAIAGLPHARPSRVA